MTTALPCITLRPDPASALAAVADDDLLANLVAFLASRRGDTDRRLGDLICALVTEGREFRQTPNGQRWLHVLADSALATKGWMLWSMLDLDRHLTGRDQGTADTPSELLDELLRQVSAVRIEQLAALVGMISEPAEAARA